MALARDLFLEYQAWLDVDLCFQGFEAELASLPGGYAPPLGGLWFAQVDGETAGVVGLRPLETDGVAEMKRLWRWTARRPAWSACGPWRPTASRR
jgi:carbonic anhydrase